MFLDARHPDPRVWTGDLNVQGEWPDFSYTLGQMATPETEGLRFIDDLHARSIANRSRLSANDRSVLRYLQRHPTDLAFATSISLAEAAGVSQAAVVRLAKRLGFDGFTEMRDALRLDMRRGGGLAERFATRPEGDVEQEFEQDALNLRETAAQVGPALDTAAREISSARRVYVAGSRESYGLALFLHRRLHIVLNDVRLIDPAFPDDVTLLESNDLLIVCTFPRYSRLTVGLLNAARLSGAKTVVLTDDASLNFLEPDDTVLVASTHTPRFHWSMVAPLAVLEALVARVAAADAGVAQRRLDATDTFKRDEDLFI